MAEHIVGGINEGIIMQQIKFRDLENDSVHGGIETDDGDVICGCCGGVFEKDEEGLTWQLINRYGNWMSLDKIICGDEIDNEN